VVDPQHRPQRLAQLDGQLQVGLADRLAGAEQPVPVRKLRSASGLSSRSSLSSRSMVLTSAWTTTSSLGTVSSPVVVSI
jgi:hypothetical protein